MHDNQQLKGIILQNMNWLILKRLLFQIILTVSNLILVRILFPSDFGTIAILQFIVTFFLAFTDLGLSRALVQQYDEPGALLLRSVWWTQVVAGLIIVGVLWTGSPIVSAYYAHQLDPRAVDWLRYLAISQLLINMTFISTSLLERHLSYGKVIIGEVLILLTTQITTVICALTGLGVISFIIGNAAGRVMGLIVMSILSPWSWGLSWSWEKLKPLFGFGLSTQFGSMLAMANSAVIPVVIGRFPGPGQYSGTEAVGFLTWAAGVAVLPAFFSGLLDQLLFPLISRLQKQPELAEKIFRRLLHLSAVTTSIITALIFVLAPQVTSILYSVRFLPAVPSLRIGLLQMLLFSVTNLAMTTLLGFGEAKFYRNMNMVWITIQWVLTIVFVSFFGFWGVNVAGLLVTVTAFYTFIRLKRHFSFSYQRILMLPFVISCITALVIFSITRLFFVETFLQLSLIAAFGIFFYSLLIYILMKREMTEDMELMMDIVKKFLRGNNGE